MRLATLPLIAAALALAACNTQRPLPTVKEAGDRAFRKGDFETANANYQEYIERKPGEAEVQLAYAKTLLELGQPAKALEHAIIAYDQRPADEEAIETLARAYFETGRTDDLYRFLRGLTEARARVEDYIRLGEYAARLGDPDGAEHALLTAAKIDKGQTVAPQLALARFYRTIGDNANALKRYRMAYYLDPKDEAIARAIRELGEIPGPTLAMPPTESSLP